MRDGLGHSIGMSERLRDLIVLCNLTVTLGQRNQGQGGRFEFTNIRLVQVIEKRTPAESVIMTRAFSPRSSSTLKPTEILQAVVQISRGPRSVETFDLNIVAVKEFPRWSNRTARGVAYNIERNNSVGVWLERDIVAQIVSGEVLGSGEEERLAM